MTARPPLVVVASLPRVCALCAGARVLRLAALAGLRGAGVVACPHCTAAPTTRPIPIITLPWRQDIPRGAP